MKTPPVLPPGIRPMDRTHEPGVIDRLVSVLMEEIVQGRLVPGQRLVEADLQAQYAASRGSVREALHQLQMKGLVVVAPNKGAAVRRLSRKEVVDLFVIRERLEGLAAELAARRVAEGQAGHAAMALLPRLLKKMSASPSAIVYGELNREFHGALLQLSDNAELIRLVHQLSLPIFQQQFRGFMQPENQRVSLAQHRKIADVVMEGKAAAAESAMRAHVRDGLKIVLSWADRNFAEDRSSD